MGLWTIIPVKPLSSGKSRLSGILSVDERALVNYRMASKTFQTFACVPELGQVLVISRDAAIRSLAESFGFLALQEDGNSSDLNFAIKQAVTVALLRGANSVLIVPADLPLLKPETIRDILKVAGRVPGMVIAPDRRLEGTNALWLSPPDLIDFQFGVGSFTKHIQQAEAMHASIEIFQSPGFGVDLDLPDDLMLIHLNDPTYSCMRSHL